MELVKLETIKNALPESQLRHSGSWLFSPQPLALDKQTTKALTQLGHPLAQFQRASDSIYQRSAKGKLPDVDSPITRCRKTRLDDRAAAITSIERNHAQSDSPRSHPDG